MTSQEKFAALVTLGKTLRRHQHQHWPLQQLPHQQDCANRGAQATQAVGRINASGTNVLDVLHALQDGSGEVAHGISDEA